MPFQRIENRELVKSKMLRCKMTKEQFDKLSKIAEKLKVTRSEVVRILIDKTFEEHGL